MPNEPDHSLVHLQKLADANDFLNPCLDAVIRDCLKIQPRMNPRTWEFGMAYLALDDSKLLDGDSRGISFGSGREPLVFAVAACGNFLCVTDLYKESSIWDTASTDEPRNFVLQAAPAGFDTSRIEVRSMDMREIAYPD